MKSRVGQAEQILAAGGHVGLWEWAMEQRRSVRPPNWDELAYRLANDTGGQVRIKGEMLRKWLLAAEAERPTRSPRDQA